MRVLSTVGGDWPRFYLDLGFGNVTAVDLSLSQIKYFHSSFTKEDWYHQRCRLIWGNLLDVSDVALAELISQMDVIDLSNVFDYVYTDRELLRDVSEFYFYYMKQDAEIIVTSGVIEAIDTVEGILGDTGFEIKHLGDVGTKVRSEYDDSAMVKLAIFARKPSTQE